LFGKIFKSEGAEGENISFESEEASLEGADQGSLAEDNQPLRVTILNKVQHGPQLQKCSATKTRCSSRPCSDLLEQDPAR
jgi:hypothetical protein